MLDEQLLQQIKETTDLLGLHSSIIEKDYYVTNVINALAPIEDENFKLIFCGGTCLAKAHKIVQRMSEDIDFKIIYKHSKAEISKSKLLRLLGTFREQIRSKINSLAMTIGHMLARNEGKYMRADLQYNSVFAMHTILRPNILVEFTFGELRLPTDSRPVCSLIEETLNLASLHDKCSISIISCTETAVEKWVGLTRQIIAIKRGYYHEDPNLIRHVYDLAAIFKNNLIDQHFYALAFPVMQNDAAQFKNQHPEYADDPCAEINKTMQLLKEDPIWADRYKNFITNMVFNTNTQPNYLDSIILLEAISSQVTQSFKQVAML